MNLKKRLLCLGVTMTFFLWFYIKVMDIPKSGSTHVYGWNQNSSKNINDYVNQELEPHIFPRNFCGQKSFLLVVVNIRPDNFEAREAIRETWGQKRDNVTFYFLLGEVKSANYEVQLKIKEESENYNDIIQERFIDSYNNLTLKSINMLKLFSRYCSKSYKYLMKIDDDVFLNVQNILEVLQSRGTAKSLLVGKIINDTKPFRDTSSKWYVPYEMYREEKYPDYLCGPAYVMSSDVAEKLYRCALETPIFYIEDVYVTGICAKKVNVTPQHHSMFTCWEENKYICLHRKLISLHYFTPDDMKEAFHTLNKNECPASGSLLEWIYSLF